MKTCAARRARSRSSLPGTQGTRPELVQEKKEDKTIYGLSQLSLASTLNLKAMNNMPIFHIMTGTTAEVESQLNILKVDHMIKVIGFAATGENSCQVLLVATPKQQDDELPMD